MDAIDVAGKKGAEFIARAGVHDQPRFDAALAQHAEIMQRQNRLAAESGRSMLGDNQDARSWSLGDSHGDRFIIERISTAFEGFRHRMMLHFAGFANETP